MKIHAIFVVAATAFAITVAACGSLQEAAQQGQAVATQAAELRETAQVLAPTLQAAAPTIQAQAEGLRETAQVLAPTLQAAAPTIQAVLPTLQAAAPSLEAVLPTLDALVPTLQAAGLQQTAEALATSLPELSGAQRSTAEAYATQGVGAAPSDVPVAPQSQIVFSSPDLVVYTSTLAPGAVRELYQVDMPGQGWTAATGSEQAEAVQLQFEKPDRRASVTIGPNGSGSVVQINIVPR